MDPDSNSIILQLVILLILIGVNAFFAMSEIAIVTFNDNKLKKLAEDGNKRAATLYKMVQQPSKFLSTIQIGVTMAGFLAAGSAAEQFAEPVAQLMSPVIPYSVAEPIALFVITLILGYFNLVLGELVPKRIAMHNPEKVSLAVAPIVRFVFTIAKPLVALLSVSTNAILKLIHISPEDQPEQVTEEEIRMMVDVGNEEGSIEKDEADMIDNIFEFDDITVEDVMTHRTDVAAVENTATVILHLEQVRRKTVPRHTVAALGYADYVRARRLGLDKQEQVARKQRAEYEAQMKRWRQIYDRVDHEQSAISRQDPGGGRLLKKKMKGLLSQEKRIERQAGTFEEIPDVEDAIDCRFSAAITLPQGKTVLDFQLDCLRAGDRPLARDVRLHVAGPRRVAILGENGRGKTTLLRLIWEELRLRRDIRAGYMPQNYGDVLDDRQTPVDYLAPSGDKERRTKACTLLGSLKFTPDEMRRPIAALSGGQKAKLLLAGLLLDGCDVLVLDEPTRNLSPLSCPVIREALSAYGGAILSVTHDRKFMREVCTDWYELTETGLRPLERL